MSSLKNHFCTLVLRGRVYKLKVHVHVQGEGGLKIQNLSPLSFQSASDLLKFCQLTITNILKRLKNDDRKILYNLTSKNFVRHDAAITNKDHGKAVKSR